jgi:Ser/Thr protein kinase RdoA (MazF antagonist)
MDAQEVSDAFGLGRAATLSEPVARGELGEVRRLETEQGTFAVKQEFETSDVAAAETSTAYHRACWDAGVACPEPARRPDGRFVSVVDDEQVRCYDWVDLTEPDTGLDPEAVGELVARLHRVDFPWPSSEVHPWFEAPVGAREWKGVLKASRAAGAPYADRLADLLPALLDVEQVLSPMRPVRTCHLDLWADNVRRGPDGAPCVIDFDNAGPGDPSREIAMVLFEFGRDDPSRQRALYDAYLAAGGPGRIRDRTDLALTVAELHHIGHRHLTLWVGARDPEARARARAGVEEFLGGPLLTADIDRILDAIR